MRLEPDEATQLAKLDLEFYDISSINALCGKNEQTILVHGTAIDKRNWSVQRNLQGGCGFGIRHAYGHDLVDIRNVETRNVMNQSKRGLGPELALTDLFHQAFIDVNVGEKKRPAMPPVPASDLPVERRHFAERIFDSWQPNLLFLPQDLDFGVLMRT
jgi:hypothetical protein